MRWLLALMVMFTATPAFAAGEDTPVGPQTPAPFTPVPGAELPDNMLGYWGLPDCGEPMDMVIYTPHYVLSITDDEACLQYIQSVRQGPDYHLVSTDFETFMSRRTNDGLLEEVYPEDESLHEATRTWDELATGQRFEYAHCEEPSNNWYILHGPGLVAIEHIEDVVASCVNGTQAACRKAMFDVVDDNDDGVLQPFELAYASQIVAYFDSISHQGGNQTKALRGAMNAAKERGPGFAAAMLAAADENASGDLSLDEVVAFWAAEHKGETFDTVNADLAGVEDVFPFIRPFGPDGVAGSN